MKSQVISPTAKTLVIYSDKKYEQFAENTIQSFSVVEGKFQFLYFTIDFDSDWELENVITIRLDSVLGIPHIQLMKPLVLKSALQLVDQFIYVDVDLMASRHFNYDRYINQVKEFPYSPILHETAWQRPVYFWHKNGIRYELDEIKMKQLLKVPERTQPWVTTLIMGVNQSCEWFVDEWANICKDKKLWDGSEELKSRGAELEPFRLYFHMGDETPFNVLLWKYNIKGYHATNIVIEPKQLKTVRRIEQEQIINERLEEYNPMTDCKDSSNIMVYHQLKDLEFRKRVLSQKQESKKEIKQSPKFLVVCSFYNNTIEHIRQTFDNLEHQTYKNWILIVTDDFSTNDCKAILKAEFNKRSLSNSLFYEPKFKREIYLYQNLFKGLTYDYYFDLDADDILSPKILELYAYHFEKYPEVYSIYSDFSCVNEDNKLQRFSAIKISDPLEAIDIRTNQNIDIVTSKFHSWSMFGHGHCFRKRKDNAFPIAHVGRTATDSFTLFTCLHEGNHLQLPRNLYTWKLREHSDSSLMTAEEHFHYNDNTNLAIQRYKESGIGRQLDLYDSVWMETTALSNAKFVENANNIQLLSSIDDQEIELLKDLYYDKTIIVDFPILDNCVIVWNKMSNPQKITILNYLSSHLDVRFCIYCFFDNFEIIPDKIHDAIETYFSEIRSEMNPKIPYRYFKYYRHLVITNP